MVLLNAQGQIEWCNQTAASHLGFDAQRDIQQHITHLLRNPSFVAYMQQAQTDDALVIEGRDHQPEKPVRIAIQRHGYGEGKQLLLTRDITAVEQAEAMRRDFVANVSHEIRTPLTVMSGFIETLQTRHRDSLDFHDVSVWGVKSALQAAFDAGMRSADGAPKQPVHRSRKANGTHSINGNATALQA